MLNNDIHGIFESMCSRTTTRQARQSATDMICIVFVQPQQFALLFQTIGIAFAFISQHILGVDLDVCRGETTNSVFFGWIDQQVDSIMIRKCSGNILRKIQIPCP